MKYLITPIIKHPYITTFLISIITLFFGYNLKNLQVDNDVINLLPDDHVTKIAQESIEKDFGAAEMIMIGLKTDNIFDKDLLSKIQNVSKKLKKLKIESDPFVDPETGELRTKKKKCVAGVTSLSTMNHIEGNEFGMKVAPLMKKVPGNSDEMNRLKEKVFSWDFYVGNLISSDSKATLIAVEYKSNLSPDELVRMVDLVKETIDHTQFGDGVEIFIAGEPFITAMVTKNMIRDTALMLPAVFGVVIIFLLIAMRKILNIVLIIVCIAVSVIWTMGLMAIFGITMTPTSSAIPVLLVAIGSAYSIHIINHYSEERRKGKDAAVAVENTITIVGLSVLGAALTTIAGFMSLMTSSIVPVREFGLFTGIGAGVAFIVSVIFVPALLLTFNGIFKNQVVHNDKKSRKVGIDLVPILQLFSERMIKNYKIVLSLTVLFVIIAAVFASQLYPDFNPLFLFKKKSDIRKADAFLCEKFSGTTTTVIALESGTDNYFKEPEALKKLDELKNHMEKDPIVGMVISLADPIKRMNYAMNENKKEYDSIPETKQHISQYLLLNSDPEALEGMVTTDYRKVRIMMLLKDGSSATVKKINKEIRNWMTHEMPGLKVSFAGTAQLGLSINELIVLGQIRSLVFSIVTVFIITSIILRCFVGGLLAVTPLAISVLLNFGILGMFRIPLEIGTAMISGVAIGIAVDYSIHFLNGMKHGLHAKGPEHSIREGIKLTGNAITFNALSVAFGFLVLSFSSFTNLMKLGCFIAFTMVTACTGTLLLLPVLVTVVKPKFLQQQNG